MNFNDLQESWKEEGTSQPSLGLPSQAGAKTNQPIEAIRKNMKREFFVQLIFIVILFFFPYLFQITDSILIIFYSVFGLLLVISAYYFFRFYKLFKSMHNYDANTRENLYELYLEIRLHIEMYKSFSFLLLPFVFIVLGVLEYNNHLKGLPAGEVIFYMEKSWHRIPIFVIGFTMLIVVLTEWWTSQFYGKHAKRIKELLDKFKE